MKIKYLGTAAAEGLPAVFCNCSVCRKARRLGGKNIRTRSQVIINDDLLVDFPMDTYLHALKHKLDLSAVKYVFITHSHMDHCYPQDLIMRGAPYAHGMTSPRITVYGNADVLGVFEEQTRREMKPSARDSIILNEIKPYEDVSAGDYTVTPLPAVHTAGENCFVYMITRGGKTYLHLNDTGILPESVYDAVAARTDRVDAVSFDCTYGFTEHGPGRHMGAFDAVNETEKLRARRCVDDGTVKILTHFSHNGAEDYLRLSKSAEAYGFVAAYDGFTLNL